MRIGSPDNQDEGNEIFDEVKDKGHMINMLNGYYSYEIEDAPYRSCDWCHARIRHNGGATWHRYAHRKGRTLHSVSTILCAVCDSDVLLNRFSTIVLQDKFSSTPKTQREGNQTYNANEVVCALTDCTKVLNVGVTSVDAYTVYVRVPNSSGLIKTYYTCEIEP